MPQQFLLPDLGEGLTEVEVTDWKVKPGDLVAVDQPVVEVESAKSIVELPIPYPGVVGELHAQVGDLVEVGKPLITILSADEQPIAEPSAPMASEPVAEELVPGTALRPEGADADDDASASGAVLVGYGTRESTLRLRRPQGGRFGRGRQVALAERPEVAAGSTLIDPARHSRVVSPILRRMAQEAGFDASNLAGTGPKGLVIRPDVEAAIAALQAPPAVASDHAHAPAPVVAESNDSDVRIPIAGVRKIIGTRLTRSRQSIPEVTIWLDVDATPLLEARERLFAATGDKYSLTMLIARFVTTGLKRYPALNSSIDEQAEVIVQHAAVNLGLAAQTPRGLMVPVVHGAHELSASQLRERVAEVVEHSKTGDFSTAQLSGSTFTVNNYGGFGVDGSTPIINQPEVAMLGIGRLMDRPWVVDGQVVARKVLTLTLVFDHRVCDGDVASGFLTYVARCVEEPLLAL